MKPSLTLYFFAVVRELSGQCHSLVPAISLLSLKSIESVNDVRGSPTDWKFCFDSENVTLDPSIGNWSFPCRSHYWIRGSEVRRSGSWSTEEIADGRAHDRERKSAYFDQRKKMQQDHPPEAVIIAAVSVDYPSRLSWLRRVWSL